MATPVSSVGSFQFSSWNEILEFLTKKAKEENPQIFQDIQNAKGFEKKMQKVQDIRWIR